MHLRVAVQMDVAIPKVSQKTQLLPLTELCLSPEDTRATSAGPRHRGSGSWAPRSRVPGTFTSHGGDRCRREPLSPTGRRIPQSPLPTWTGAERADASGRVSGVLPDFGNTWFTTETELRDSQARWKGVDSFCGERGHCHCPGHTPQPPSPAGASCCRAILTVTRMSTSRSRNPGMPAPLRTRDRLPRWSRRVGTVPHGLLVATVVGSPGSCESKATTRETENGAQT